MLLLHLDICFQFEQGEILLHFEHVYFQTVAPCLRYFRFDQDRALCQVCHIKAQRSISLQTPNENRTNEYGYLLPYRSQLTMR